MSIISSSSSSFSSFSCSPPQSTRYDMGLSASAEATQNAPSIFFNVFQKDGCCRFVLLFRLMASVTAAFVCACLSYSVSFCVFKCSVFSCAFLSLVECKI